MPTASELGRLLHQEHLQTIGLLNALEERTTGRMASRPLSAANAQDRALAETAVALVKREVILHFAFEETCLFPILSDLGAFDMVTMLIREHVHIGSIAGRVSDLAAGFLRDGTLGDEAWHAFRAAAGDFAEASLFHIQKEEMAVIQRLPMLLDAETDAELVRRHRTLIESET